MRLDLPTSLSLSTKLSSIKPLTTAAIAIVALGGMTSANAKTLFKDTSITLLHGGDFKLLPDDVDTLSTMTLEHASTHTWGGVFFFVDRHQGGKYDVKNNDGEVIDTKRYKETFGKFSPKFKIATFNDSFIKQVNLAGVYEFSSNSTGFGQDNYWAGVGVDLDLPIPGMKYASATLYHSFNDQKPDDEKVTLTAAWERDNFLIDGYVDFGFNSDELKNNIHFNPQIKYNLQEALGIDNRLEAGVEYSYWRNKFGVDGVDENAVMALAKYHF
ncbi:DUF5020 domain-containing protein [Psychrobacter urativorans]|uniref:DUF5020 domain-containing protein n=1 Tax=Psychrobacter urativorans TaxID=45610 RepID=UPI001D0FBE52|nr:DUF5020 domain-containing protein [Psychrobacter urativorans]